MQKIISSSKRLLCIIVCVMVFVLCFGYQVRAADDSREYYDNGSGFISSPESAKEYKLFCSSEFSDGTGHLYVQKNNYYVVRVSFGSQYITMWEGSQCENFKSDIQYAYGTSYNKWNSDFWLVDRYEDWKIHREGDITYLDYNPKYDTSDKKTIDIRVYRIDGDGNTTLIKSRTGFTSAPSSKENMDDWCRRQMGDYIDKTYLLKFAKGKWDKSRYTGSDGSRFYKHSYIVEAYYTTEREISFHANGGTGNMNAVKTTGSITLPANMFTKTGYGFAGWATSSSGEVAYKDGVTITPSDNMTLYAVWTINSYPVTYIDVIGNPSKTELGRSIEQKTYQSTVNGSDKGSNTAMSAYYTGYQYTNSTSAKVDTSGAIVYRIFTPASCTITFQDVVGNTSGKVLGSTTAIRDYGTNVSGSEQGTSTEDSAYYTGYRYNSSTQATVQLSGTTVYRIFTPIAYNVIYKDVVKSQDGKVLGGTTEKREFGMTVDGAQKGSSMGMGVYYIGYRYSSSTSSVVGTDGATVYRIFIPATCTVTYQDVVGSASGRVLGSTTASCEFGTSVSGAEKGDSTEDGAYYAGYRYTNSTTETVAMSGTTVYRIFQPILYPVTYKDVAKGVDGKVLGSSIDEKDFAADVSGAEKGTDSSTGTYYEGYQYSFSTSSVVGVGGVTVYRIFTPASYEVIYQDVVRTTSGKRLGSEKRSKEYDSTVDADELGTDPTTGAYYTGYKYRSSTSATVKTAENLVYRIFEPESYAIHFDLNGGTIINGNVTSYFYEEGAVLPTAIERTGYTFLGWYEHVDLSGEKVMEVTKEDIGEKSFYAKWEKTPYSVFLTGGLDGADIKMIREGMKDPIADTTGYIRDTVQIFVGSRAGYEFDFYQLSSPVIDANKEGDIITFMMPAKDVVVELVWKECTGIVTQLNQKFYDSYRDCGDWYDAANNAYDVDDNDIVITPEMLTTKYLIANTKTNEITEVMIPPDEVVFLKRDEIENSVIVAEAGVNLFTVQAERYGKAFTADFTLIGTSKILNNIMDRTDSDTYRELDSYITSVEKQAESLNKEINDLIQNANDVLEEAKNTDEVWEGTIENTKELSQAFANAVSKSAALDEKVKDLLEKTLDVEMTDEQKASFHLRVERLQQLVIQLKRDSDRYHILLETLNELGFDTSNEDGLAEQVKSEVTNLRDRVVSQSDEIEHLNDQITKIKEVFRKEKQELEEKYKNEIENLNAKHQTELEELQKQHEKEIADLTERYEEEKRRLEEEIKNLIEAYEEQLAKIKQEEEEERNKLLEQMENQKKQYEEELSRLKQQYEAQLSEQKERYEKELSDKKKQHEMELEELKKSYEKKIADLIEREQAKREELLDKIEQLKKGHEKEVEELKKKLEAMESDHQNKLLEKIIEFTKIKELSEERLKKMREELIEITESYEKEQNKNQELIQKLEELEQLILEKDSLIEEQKKQISNLQYQLEGALSQLVELERRWDEEKQSKTNVNTPIPPQSDEKQTEKISYLQQKIEQLEQLLKEAEQKNRDSEKELVTLREGKQNLLDELEKLRKQIVLYEKEKEKYLRKSEEDKKIIQELKEQLIVLEKQKKQAEIMAEKTASSLEETKKGELLSHSMIKGVAIGEGFFLFLLPLFLHKKKKKEK